MTFLGVPLSGQMIAFFILALWIIGCGVAMLSTTKTMYMAVAIGGVFIGIAGLYFLLNAEFLGVAQIAIYAGAVTILMLFAVMLTPHDLDHLKTKASQYVFSAIGVIILLLVLITGIRKTQWVPLNNPDPSAGNDVATIGKAIFTQYAIPFELVSLILIVALVGAVVLGRKEGDQ
ncbi:NADH-quinone oxidoreductase subunit J [Fodinisporobacter ferrooxydans]|uniref:NADH-quinone oxidoreductase subunit J n=1 Tax=Fodinisporobacter ferrooxydans TaxID=2901836 RepID=A0ABY4CM44_9BACL|nr:NADH-quinone oxidoreductase subunit J [Alicyclobacillaceae bacterium MYW30-H2]